GALVAVALVAAALAVASRTGAARALERRAVVRVLEAATGERVTLAGVGGTLGHSLVLEDLRLGAGGRTVVHVPRLEIVYAPLALVHGVVRLKRVNLAAPRASAPSTSRAGGAGSTPRPSSTARAPSTPTSPWHRSPRPTCVRWRRGARSRPISARGCGCGGRGKRSPSRPMPIWVAA